VADWADGPPRWAAIAAGAYSQKALPKETLMLLRTTLCCAVAAAWLGAALGAAAARPASAQPAATQPAAAQPAAAQPAPLHAPDSGLATKPSDPFGLPVTLAAKPIVYVKGSGKWVGAFATISGALKKVEAYMATAGLKPDGLPMTIFTATDEQGFDYQAAVPIAALPKDEPHGEIAFGNSPEGKALEFVHRGSYEALDDTYEAITNYLDGKDLESKDILIEQYVTDPASADENKLVVNVLVFIK
jgi:effector-binding domain-containing protein